MAKTDSPFVAGTKVAVITSNRVVETEVAKVYKNGNFAVVDNGVHGLKGQWRPSESWDTKTWDAHQTGSNFSYAKLVPVAGNEQLIAAEKARADRLVRWGRINFGQFSVLDVTPEILEKAEEVHQLLTTRKKLRETRERG